MGQVGDGSGGDVAAPAVFDGHGDAEGDAEIAGLAGLGQAAEFADLDVDGVHGVVAMGGEEGVDAVNGFVEDEGVRGAAADGEVGVIGEAGLFDIDVDILDAADDACGLVDEPAGVGVGDEDVAGAEDGGHGVDAFDVGVGVGADFELKTAVAFGAVGGDGVCHFGGGALGDGAVEDEVVAVASAEEDADGLSGGLAEDVPAGDVDAGFDVGVALEGAVHLFVEDGQLAGVEADEVGRKLGEAGADTGGVGGQIEGAEGADFAVADEAGVGLDLDDGAVEDVDRFAAGPGVAAFVEG